MLTQGNDDKAKSAEKGPRGAARFDSRHLNRGQFDYAIRRFAAREYPGEPL